MSVKPPRKPLPVIKSRHKKRLLKTCASNRGRYQLTYVSQLESLYPLCLEEDNDFNTENSGQVTEDDGLDMTSVPKDYPRRQRRHRCPSLCEVEQNGEEREPLLTRENDRYGSGNNSWEQSSQRSGDAGAHCHQKDSSRSRLDKPAVRKLIIASVLCLLFMVVEIVGGIMANSLAIATDAAHLLTDFASFMISLFSLVIAARAPTKRMSFGWYRAEVMGALVSVMMIWVVTGVLVYLAIRRVITDDYEIDATVMLITSAAGVTFNIIMGACLHGSHGHSHGGGGGHSHSLYRTDSSSSSNAGNNHGNGVTRTNSGDDAARHHISQNPHPPDLVPSAVQNNESSVMLEEDTQHNSNDNHISESEHSLQHSHDASKHQHDNINVRAAFIHVLGDLVQSIGVLIAAYIIYYKPEWKLADPICTFIFSILVIITTITILKDAVTVLMEGAPSGLSFTEIKNSLLEIEGVREVHNLRIWSLSVNKCALAVHLALDKPKNGQMVLAEAGAMMRQRYGIVECTVQIEDYVDEMMDCTQCQDPRD